MVPSPTQPLAKRDSKSNRRLFFWYGLLIFILGLFIARLFYLQIIRHDYYRSQALSDQLKEYAIQPAAGLFRLAVQVA